MKLEPSRGALALDPSNAKNRGGHSGVAAAEVGSGIVVGAALGLAIGGPLGSLVAGLVAGSALGGVTGIAVALATRGEAQRAARDAKLDEEIGVYGGSLGRESPPPGPAFPRTERTSHA